MHIHRQSEGACKLDEGLEAILGFIKYNVKTTHSSCILELMVPDK